MKITLNDFERQYLITKARAYERKTGDRFSARFILSLICEEIEAKLPKTIDKILEEKERNFDEQKALEEITPSIEIEQ